LSCSFTGFDMLSFPSWRSKVAWCWRLLAVYLFLFLTRCSSADSEAYCTYTTSFDRSHTKARTSPTIHFIYHARYAKGAAKSLREN
jgi:hypothetical protein